MSKEYFPHDYGARLSLRAIRKDFGLEGVGFYWCFVEMLHEEDGYIKESDIESIAYDLQTKTELAEAIIRNYDLFTIKKGKIYSERVLKNIKKRAEISAARKNAADARWKGGESDEEPLQTTPTKTTPAKPKEKVKEPSSGFYDEEEQEKFDEQVKWFRDIIESNFQKWADEEPMFSSMFDMSFSVRELINNIIDEVAAVKTLKINNRNIDTIDFLQTLNGFLANSEKREELVNAIFEVEEKHKKGEVKNKQNYLISTLWNKAKMSI